MYISITVKYGSYKLVGKAVGVRVKRDDGVLLADWEYFPLSQVQLTPKLYNNSIDLKIPKWLYDKKISKANNINILK